jgi:hypothetical protein
MRTRFVPMFGIYGMAEAVNILMDKENLPGATVTTKRPTSLAIASRPAFGMGGYDAAGPCLGWAAAVHHARADSASTGAVTRGCGSLMARSRIRPVMCWPGAPPRLLPLGDQRDPDPGSHHTPESAGAAAALQGGARHRHTRVHRQRGRQRSGSGDRLHDPQERRGRFAEEGSRLQTTCLGAEASDVTAIRQRTPRVVPMSRQSVSTEPSPMDEALLTRSALVSRVLPFPA